MKSDKPRRFSSTVLGIMIVISTLAVINFASTNVLATNYYHDTDLVIDHAIWNESDSITLYKCNLIIEDGGILTYNDSVTLSIINDDAGEYGIIIEEGGQFIINSPSGNTEITSTPADKTLTYPFLNSGTIDFLGATVERVYGDPGDKETTGGIRNLPGSSCALENCNIIDGDTHGVYVEGNSTDSVTLNIANCMITNTTSNVLDGCGFFIKGNTNILIDNVTVNNTNDDGIRIIDSEDISIQGETMISGSQVNGIYLENSDGVVIGRGTEIQNCQADGIYLTGSGAVIDGVNIHENGGRGIYLELDNSSYISNNTIEMNYGFGGIQGYGNDHIDINNNTISGNYYGIYLGGTNISVTDNNISTNSHTGIYLEGAFNDIVNNYIFSNIYGIKISSSFSNISNNNVSSNGIYGIQLYSADCNNIVNNTISNTSYTPMHGTWYGYGLYLDSSDENTVSNNTISSNLYYGIWYEYSSHNKFTNNTILNNGVHGIISWTPYDNNTIECNNVSSNGGAGIRVGPSNDNMINDNIACNNLVGIIITCSNSTVINNTASDNSAHGIYMAEASDNLLANNTMSNNGLFLYGNSLSQWNSHEIDTSNTVNGLPVRYWKNQTSGTLEPGAGEIIIANCTNVVVENQDIDYGIIIGVSNNNTISNNNASNSRIGICLYSSNNNTIINNTAISNNLTGIQIITSDNNIIEGNIIASSDYGVYLQNSESNTIVNNTVHSNYYAGVYLEISEANTIVNNSVSSNDPYGIFLFNSNGNDIINNTASLNDDYGIFLESCNWCTISNNTASSNGNTGIVIHSDGANIISNNTASSNDYTGIFLYSSVGNILENNTMVDDGIYISGPWLSGWNTHTIDDTNTVNGNPVRYWKNQNSGTVASGAGQVILANCTNVVVENQDLSGGTVGITLGFSDNNAIANNTASSNNLIGIYLYFSYNNSVTNNSASSNDDSGIFLSFSLGNIIDDNTVSQNNYDGICLEYSCNSTIANNVASSNADNGISLIFSDSNNVVNNTVQNNIFGISIYYSFNNTVANNIIGDVFVTNETVYITVGYGNDTSPQYLDHADILNCTLYIDFNGTEWYLMIEGDDYILDYETGQIDIDWMPDCDENWTFCAYYNYTGGNEYGILCDNSDSVIINNTISGNVQTGIYMFADFDYSFTPLIELNYIGYNNDNGIHVLGSNITISNNTITGNVGSGLWMENCTGEIVNNTIKENEASGICLNSVFSVPRYILNETVYVSVGYGNDTPFLYLDHANILNCTLYIDVNGTEWYLMVEDDDYTLDYETGQIEVDWMWDCDENWTFYAYYNYTDVVGNYYYLTPWVVGNQIIDNFDDGIFAFSCIMTILNNTISGNTGSGIWMENCTGEISNNTITENHQSSGGGGPPQMSGIDLFDCQGIQISHNNISENHVNVYVVDSENITIEWNEMLDENAIPYTGAPAPRGIYSISSQIIASNNTIWGTCFGIDLEDADNETVLADNKFYRIESLNPSTGTEIGIRLIEASPILERNLFDGIKDGIKCYENSSAYIHNNTIINCTYDGIYLEWSEAIIIGNNISGNGGWGVLSKYAAPQNAGTNGTGLISDNPLIGSNGLGMVTQIWTLKVLVINRTTNASVPWQYVQVDDRYNNTVWVGYTDSLGYTEYIDVSQYGVINSTITWNYTPFQVYTEYPGTPTVGIVETNTIMTVYMD